MKKNIRLTISYILVSILLFAGCINTNEKESIKIAEKEDLSLLINMDNHVFNITDYEIPLEIVLENNNKDPIYIEKGFNIGRNLWIEITDPTNKTLYPAVDPIDPNLEKIILEKEKKLNVNLLDFIYNAKGFSEQRLYLNSTGNYSIKAFYESFFMRDRIYSNELRFEII
jgi:hypothetical protein